MGAPAPAVARVARVAFGVAVLTIAAGAHVSAGGSLPSITVLALLAIPVTIAAVILPRRRCKPASLLAFMTVAQVLLHETFRALTVYAHGEMSAQMAAGSASAMSGEAGAQTYGWSGTMKAVHVVAIVGPPVRFGAMAQGSYR